MTTICEKIKGLNGRVKERARRIFGRGSNIVPSSSSLRRPNAELVSSSINHIADTLAALDAPDPVPRPASAPPGGDQAAITAPALPACPGSNVETQSLGFSLVPDAVTLLHPGQASGSLSLSPTGSQPDLASGGGSGAPIGLLPNIQVTSTSGIPTPSSIALPAAIDTIPQSSATSQATSGRRINPTPSNRVPPDPLIVTPRSNSAPHTLTVPNTPDPIAHPVLARPMGSLAPHSDNQAALASGNIPTASTGSPPIASIVAPNSSAVPKMAPMATPNDPSSASQLVLSSTARGLLKLNGSERVIDKGWRCLSGFLEVLNTDSNAFGPLKMVVDEFAKCINMHEDAMEAQHDYSVLKAELEALFSELSNHFVGDAPPTITASMENLCNAIEREMDRISTKEERRAWRRHYEAKKDLDDVMKCYRRVHGYLERLNINANLSIWKLVDMQKTEAQLKSLTASMSACYNSAEAALVRRRECTPKTRKQVLSELGIWRHDKQQGNLYWLDGMAGTGKTTIASSLCAMLDRSHELGASFFCTRLLPECRNVNLILPTIAYQLARYSHPFCRALCRALERDPDAHTKTLSKQLEVMLVEPLREVASTLPINLVVVIDALDECDDNCGVGLLLELLAAHTSELEIKVFVSSRPEPQIRQKIGGIESKLVLHELEKSVVKEDIRTYLQVELASMSLSESDLAALVERAGMLFIYAATVVRYIGAESFSLNPQKRLAVVLDGSRPDSSNQSRDIDTLYGTVLKSAFNNPELEDGDKEQMKLVLDTVICAQEPLTLGALAGLLQLGDTSQVHTPLRPLWSVIHIAGDLVTTLHASFPEYMLDPKRSQQLVCSAEVHHGHLAELCFERIRMNQRQFNVCELQSSYMHDKQLPDLTERVKRAIPLDFSYACQYWAVHLGLGGQSDKRSKLLDDFLSKRLLLWMEVLNLTKQMRSGATSLNKAKEWCKNRNGAQEAEELIHDAWRFVTVFAASSISSSTPHIYLSMLASWPRSRPIAGRYLQRAKGLAELEGTGVTRRQLALLSVFAVGSEVNSVALSPDGTRIISGTNDATMCIWDMQSGQQVLPPLEGHTSMINSVAFSPDCMRIVSGSFDNTIRVWDAQNGRQVLIPLEGHTDSVNSVAFSPDGMHIVSGSSDNTIRIWDVQNGQQALATLEGHTDSVNSVAFSPDGAKIASGSSDNKICVWDVQSGQQVLAPLEGHTSLIHSVAFSPDSMHIVSGSSDNTIRIWDVQTGQQALAPLEGHTDSVYSVAFSPDSTHIVSGSNDKTIRVWDMQTGQQMLAPHEGHTDSVCSVIFSSDGMCIISGSSDKTIRVWDMQTGQQLQAPLKGHTDRVNSVIFSPDGTSIVSGSSDKTICLWDAQSGQQLLVPLKRHTSSVYSIALSPDGARIISGSSDKTIRVWDSQTGQQLLAPLKGHTDLIYSVAFSPDCMRIVSGSYDKTIRIWDVHTGQQVLAPLEGHASSVNSVAFSPDGMRIISGSSDNTIRVWDIQSGQQVLAPLKGHDAPVRSVAFSPDGKLIVSGSSDMTIRVWDVQSGQQILAPLEGHTSLVRSVAFSPDGMRIVSGSYDKTIRVWDVETGQQVLPPLKGHTAPVRSVAFSPDGLVVSGSWDRTIRVWDVQTNHRTPTAIPHPNPDLLPSPNTHCPPGAGNIATDSTCNALTSYVLDENGWVLDEHQHLILWVPPDLRDRLLINRTVILISTMGSVYLDFKDAKHGESWVKCYAPAL